MVFKASEVQRRLEKLGCFRNVGIVIDTSKSEDSSSDGYEVSGWRNLLFGKILMVW
jgi:hypothetical protein